MKIFLLVLWIFFAAPVFAAGTLEVNVSSYAGIVPKNGVRIPFLTIQATAKDDTVKISEINIRRTGLSEDTDMGRIIAITHNYHRSSRTGLYDGTATLKFRRPLTIDINKTETIVVYGNMQMTATSGRTIGLSLEGIESDAEKVAPREQRPMFKQTVIRKKRAYKVVCKNRKCVRVKR